MKPGLLHIALIYLMVVGCQMQSIAQDTAYDSLLAFYLREDSIMLNELEWQLEADSMDIFQLMDILLKSQKFSQLTFRAGYTSDIAYAGRNFGFRQYGFNAGVAYYHKSGAFADVAGFWNSEMNPNYNPTITTVGYLGSIGSKWAFSLSYDHFFYNYPTSDEESYYFPLTNSLNANNYLDIGKFTAMLDYSFLFGEETAHRIRPGVLYNMEFKKVGFIDRIIITPGASVLIGDANIYKVTPMYPEFNLRNRYDVRQIMFREYGEGVVRLLWRRDRDRYYELEKYTFQEFADELAGYSYEFESAFGIMNYNLSLPVFIYMKRFTVALSYFYNIPVALPGETLDLTPNSYMNASLIYNLPLKSKRK